ncbi:hypothetical protein JNW88_20130, partial [Micromonospora sp. ATA32]|nr:hypothetical protein [Micromonospora sp. ATA32]
MAARSGRRLDGRGHVGRPGVGWLADQVLLASGLDRWVWLWPAVALLTVLLVGVPALLLALLPRAGAVRVTGRAWLAGVLALGALTLLRALPPVHHEAYLAALAGTAVLLAAVLGRLTHPGRRIARPGAEPADHPDPAVDAGEHGRNPAATPTNAVGPGRRPRPARRPFRRVAAADDDPAGGGGWAGPAAALGLARRARRAAGDGARRAGGGRARHSRRGAARRTFWSRFAVGEPPRPARLVPG